MMFESTSVTYVVGSLTVDPTSGFFGNTSFTLSASEGWEDDAEDLPLTYQFGYYTLDQETGERQEALLEEAREESELTVDLLPQGKVLVF